MPNTISVAAHSELVRDINEYCTISDFVNGRLNILKERHLIIHPTESQDTENSRTARSYRLAHTYYINLLEPLLNIHVSHLSQPITWDQSMSGDVWDLIRNDADGYGQAAEEMARWYLWYRIGWGRVGILVDGPSSIAESRAEAVETKERSYQVLYRPEQIRYWSRFSSGTRRGEFSEVILEDEPLLYDGKYYETLRRYYIAEADTAFSWQRLKASGDKSYVSYDSISGYCCGSFTSDSAEYEVIEEGIGALSSIPFVTFGRGRDDAILKDAWSPAKALFNHLSVHDGVARAQGHQRILATGAEAEELKFLAGNTIAVCKNPDAAIQVVPAGIPEALQGITQRLGQQIQRIVLLQHHQRADDTRQVESAESKTKDLIARQKQYDAWTDELEDVLVKVYSFHAEYEGLTPPESIQIARDFQLEDEQQVNAELSLAFSQATQLGAEPVRKNCLKVLQTKIKPIPLEGEDEQTARKRLMDSIDVAAVPEPQSFGFGGGIKDRFRSA